MSVYVLVLCGLFEPRTEYVTTVTRDREWDELKLVEAVWSIGKKDWFLARTLATMELVNSGQKYEWGCEAIPAGNVSLRAHFTYFRYGSRWSAPFLCF